MRRCLDCPKLIDRGSRCRDCAAAYRVPTQWAREVKARDNARCVVSGCATPYDRVQADHVTPRAAGGQHTLANGRTLCHRHHQERHVA